jgi:hypothetical protein
MDPVNVGHTVSSVSNGSFGPTELPMRCADQVREIM